jgi:hypothetical protein
VKPALALLAAALAVLALAPGLTRLAGLLASAGALLAALALAGNMKAAGDRLAGAPARRVARGALRVLACLAALAAAGALTSLPAVNVAAPHEAFLPEETLELLRRLDREVVMTARVSPDRTSEGPARHLLGLYAKASPWVSFTVGPAQGGTAPSEPDEIALAAQDTVTLSASGFEETVFPITRGQLDAAIRRLVSPPRLVYCLMGEGAKSSMDTGPRGLSAWAGHLARRKIYVRDWEWAGDAPLPPEAHALVYAGPRMPPDPAKERELLDYLARGGRLMSLNDPMVAALDPALFAPLSLRLPEGLVYDQTRNWAGTDDAFIVADDFPAHPATLGMRGPVIFPLAGAVFTRDIAAGGTAGSGEAPGTSGTPRNGGDPAGTDAPGNAEGSAAPEGGGNGAPGAAQPGSPGDATGTEDFGGEGAVPASPADATGTEDSGGGGAVPAQPADAGTGSILAHSWAVALTSGAAFLETDRASIGRGEPRFDRERDPAGPMVLVSATTLAGGGRLVLAADSDFASNSYIGFAGNLDFATGLASWLVGDEDDLSGPRRGTVLMLTDSVSRLLFWGPVVFWPLLVLSVWGVFFLRRRKASA